MADILKTEFQEQLYEQIKSQPDFDNPKTSIALRKSKKGGDLV